MPGRAHQRGHPGRMATSLRARPTGPRTRGRRRVPHSSRRTCAAPTGGRSRPEDEQKLLQIVQPLARRSRSTGPQAATLDEPGKSQRGARGREIVPAARRDAIRASHGPRPRLARSSRAAFCDRVCVAVAEDAALGLRRSRYTKSAGGVFGKYEKFDADGEQLLAEVRERLRAHCGRRAPPRRGVTWTRVPPDQLRASVENLSWRETSIDPVPPRRWARKRS